MADEFWSPKPVQHYHDYLQRGLPADAFMTYRRAYIRNIAYAFQYLEYTAHTIGEPLHAVVENQLYKTFIITGCGIVESTLWMLLKGNGHQKQNHWEPLQERETNAFSDGTDQFKFEVRHFKKLAIPVDIEMRFIDMCRRAESKKVLGIASDVYAKIGHLRTLRNRVHIHAVQHDRDNDWWTFRARDFNTMREVLVAILKADIFDPFPRYGEMFDWLDENV